MSFDSTWLDLREPADHAARSQELLQAFATMMPKDAHLLDMGSGTGSTMRAVSPLLPDATWTLTDYDPALLALAKERAPDVETVQVDLSENLGGVLAREADAITASALIDLVSAEWLDALVAHLQGRVVYIALSYDGREEWLPPHDDDGEILEAFQSHQRGDKGFGPALGADAVPYLSKALVNAGYRTKTAPSPWNLQPGALMDSLSEGIANAAMEAGVTAEKAKAWADLRSGSTNCCINHIDLLAYK